MVDRLKAFEIEDGLLLENGSHISSGSAVPSHLAENGDVYIQTNGIIWKYVEDLWVRVLDDLVRGESCKATFHTSGPNDGELDYEEFFYGPTQTTPNRRARVDMTYDGSLNPLTEVWKFYDANGTTILFTYTITHTWSGFDYVSSNGVLS